MSSKLLLLLVLGIVFFSACSDDDKKDDKPASIVGTWKFDSEDITWDNAEAGGTVNTPLVVNIVTPNDSTVLDFGMGGMKVSNQHFAYFIADVIDGYGYLDALNWIQFTGKGEVVISYTTEGKTEEIPAGVIRYYLKGDNKVYLGVNKVLVTTLLESLNVNIDLTKVPGIVEMGEGDIAMPLMYTIKGGELLVYVTKDMMMPYFDLIAGFVPDIAMQVNAIKVAASNATVFDMGLRLEKK